VVRLKVALRIRLIALVLFSALWSGWVGPGSPGLYTVRLTIFVMQFTHIPSPDTPGYATANLLFAVLFILCAYNFFRAITLDPGVCPVPAGEEEKKLVRVSYLE
jgi:hypothetical protein